MAYIALYRKWRPALFEDVVGQQHITKTLQKAIDTDKVAHAYLFSGPRGTGKTSTAKIFAKAMNCVNGPTSHPCNTCEICRHITDGESLDVVEIDAASNRSIEDIRTLRETIKFMPAEGNKKIYIIDEVHMLTTEAFNALLKTLEEPPAHVIFILATTEPEKIPMTILSRCQRYEFRRITSEDIAGRLLFVAEREHIALTKGAAHILAVQADGGMRDALSMLDQCVSNTGGTIDEDLVRDLLGLIGRDWLFTLATAVFENRGSTIIKAVDDIIHMGKEPRVILTELAAHMRALMIYQADPGSDTLSAYADSMEQLAGQSKAVEPRRIFDILAVLQQALLTARTSPTPRIAVEMGLLMAARTDSMEVGRESSAKVAQPQQVVAKPAPKPVFKPATEPVPVATPSPEPVIPDVVPIAGTTPAPVTAAGDNRYQEIWQGVCQSLEQQKKKAVLSCMRNGHIVYIGEDKVIVSFKTAFMVKRANKEDYCKCVDDALHTLVGPGYHMQGYQTGDADLAEYEKKKTDSGSVMPKTTTPIASEEPHLLQLADVPQEDRDTLLPWVQALGDCDIYMEDKTDTLKINKKS